MDQQLPSSSAVVSDRSGPVIGPGMTPGQSVGVAPMPSAMGGPSSVMPAAPAAPSAFPPDLLSPAVAPDAQTLAAALQEQLDLINREIR